MKINTKMKKKMVVNIHIIKNTKGKQESQTKCKQDHNNTWTFTDIRVKDKREKRRELHQTGALMGLFAQL